MPNHLRICPVNIFDAANGCLMTASPAMVATLPETFVQTPERNKRTQSTSLASQELRASWVLPQRMNFIFVGWHNLTAAATIAHPNYTDSAFSSALNTNAAALCFGYSGFSVYDTLTDADFQLLKNSSRFFPLVTTMKSQKVVILDAANPDGCYRVSRLFGGEHYEFEYQIPGENGALTFDDFGTQDKAHDGSVISDKGAKGRKLELSSEFFTPADWKHLLAIERYCGKDKQVCVMLHPEDGTYLEAYNQVICKFEQLTGLSRANSLTAGKRLVLIES